MTPLERLGLKGMQIHVRNVILAYQKKYNLTDDDLFRIAFPRAGEATRRKFFKFLRGGPFITSEYKMFICRLSRNLNIPIEDFLIYGFE